MGLSRFYLLCVAACSLSAVAAAQDGYFARDRNVSVTERPRPEYQSAGIQRGAFIFKPTLFAGLELNDNVYATETNEQSDTIFLFDPSLDLSTTWSRHALNASVNVSHREYTDLSDETVTDFGVLGGGRVDIKTGYQVDFTASYDASHEPRTSAGAASRAAEPISFDAASLGGSFQRQVGRTIFIAGLTYSSSDYDDVLLNNGVLADQDFRDNDQIIWRVRGGYAISPDTALFVNLAVREQDYDEQVGQVTRDQDGYTLTAGANFDLTNLVRGEVGVGYTNTSYDATGVSDSDGFAVDANVEWFITPLMTAKFTANRDFRASGLVGALSSETTTAAAELDYELRRNVILSAGYQYASDDYQSIDRTDDTNRLFIGANYLLNRYIGLTARISHLERDSAGTAAQSGFDVDQFLIGVTLKR